tara:strand:- start:13266 stop:16391 length:3126 start_codon:yes stop_codon:yes gene_type:complete
MKFRGIITLVFALTVSVSYSQGANNWQIGNPYVSRTDAAFSFNEDYGTLISGKNILFEPISNNPSLESIPNSLSIDLFPNPYKFKPVDAALDIDQESFLLFKGNVFVTVNKATLQSTSGAAQWNGWPGFWKNKIDAALQWNDGSYVFIKGLQYVSYNPRSKQTSRPNQLNRLAGWPSTWSGSIDAAFNGKDGYYYFIRKGEILAMDSNNLSIAIGYPKKLSGAQSGIIIQNTNMLTPQNTNANITINNNINNTKNSMNTGDWCPVGVPDASTSPDGGNIAPVTTELAGGTGGEKFSDKLVRGVRVKEVRVWGINTIQALEIVTISKEGFVTEGGPKGFAFGKPKVFSLVPGECINGIEGTWDGTSGKLIHTLRFITNKRKSNWFGSIAGRKGKKEFLFEVPPEGAFSGFYGYSSKRNLISLGIKYNIYQYVVFDENGKLIETTGDKTKWNKGTQSLALQEYKKDPNDLYIDKHKPAGNKRDLFLGQKMPQFEWLAQPVDLAKIDPWNITSKSSIAGLPRTYAVVPIPSEEITLVKETGVIWLGPHGMNGAVSKTINSGNDDMKTVMSKSFSQYSREFSIKVEAEFNAGGVAGGGINASYKERKTSSIGTEKVLMSRKVINQSHKVSIDLDWDDPITGKKYRQFLSYQFRKIVDSLPIPSGKIPDIKTAQLKKGGKLPGTLERYKKIYIDKIINNFGTHFLNDVMFGGKYIMHNEVYKEEITKSRMSEAEAKVSFNVGSDNVMKSDGTTIIINNGTDPFAMAGKALTGNSTASGSIEGSIKNSYENSKKRLETTMRIEAVGGGGSTDYAIWTSNVSRSPVVIDYSLIPHTDLLTKVFFPSDKKIDKKRKLLDLIIRQYLIDNSINLNHSPGKELTFPGVGDRSNDSALDKDVKIKLEVVSIKTNMEDGDTKDVEIQGNTKLEILKKDGSLVKAIEDVLSGIKNMTKDKSLSVNQSITFTVKQSEIEELKLIMYGTVIEIDDTFMDGNDDVYDISRLDAKDFSSDMKFSTLIDEKVVNAKLKIDGEEGFMEFSVKISLIKEKE